MNNNLPSIKILGTNITNASKEEILEYIFKGIDKKREKFYIVTPNPEILVYAARSKAFQQILNGARVSIADGIGVVMADNILEKKGLKRITGVDLIEDICAQSSNRAFTVGFLGGRDGVAEKTAECLKKKYPHLRVSFVGEEWDVRRIKNYELGIMNNDKKKYNSLVVNHEPSLINHIDILFVAFGFPKQEEWIAENLHNIPVTVAMGVGGAFDYISGKVVRAPKVVRSAGLEWAFRLMVQPWRMKRQLALPVFSAMILKEKISKRS